MNAITEILNNPVALIEAGFAAVYAGLCAAALWERHHLKCALYLAAAALAITLAVTVVAAGR